MRDSGRSWGTGVDPEGDDSARRTQLDDEKQRLSPGEWSPWLDIAVEDRRLFTADAALVVAVGTWKLLEKAVDVSAWTNIEEGVLELSAREPPLQGGTGPLRFEVAGSNTSYSPRRLERVTGRFAFVNRKHHGWVSLATLDLDGTGMNPIVHTLNATLGQRAWEEEAVEYGAALSRDGGKPFDACECVIWKKLPPNANLKYCVWSAEVVVVMALGVVLILAAAAAVWYSRRKRVEWSERVVTKRMRELRVKLRMRKRDGFVLSSESRGFNLFGREIRVIQRKQLEALARMTLLFDFEVRALDSLAWTLLSPTLDRPVDETGKVDRAASATPNARYEEQYRELRNVLLDTSKVLLDPSLDPNQVAETVGRVQSGSRSTPYQWLQSPQSREGQLTRGMSLKRELVGHVVFQAEHTHAAAQPSKRWSTHRRSTNTDVEDEEARETIEDRFNFFSKQVAQVQVWQEDHHSLFKELKDGPVQDFMDTLHRACDALFQTMLQEEQGDALVNFHYPPQDHAAALVPAARIADDVEPRGADAPDGIQATTNKVEAWTADGGAGNIQNPAAPPRRSLCSPPKSPAENPVAPPRVPSAVATAATLPGTADSGEEAESEDASLGMLEVSASVHRPRSERGSCADAHIVIRRQDHPRVRAIRLNEEDWREVDLERTSSFKLLSAEGGTLGEVVRPVKDEEVYISQLYRRAVLLNDEFQVRVRKAAERRFGRRVAVHPAPVKTKMRMREKLLCYATDDAAEGAEGAQGEATEELPLAAYILDPIRATVVCDGPAEMLEVARWLVTDGESEGLPVVRVKNKFAVPDASEYDGYRDLMVCALYTGSHDLSIIGEIQIHDRRLHSLKLQMHKLYKCKRATKATMI